MKIQNSIDACSFLQLTTNIDNIDNTITLIVQKWLCSYVFSNLKRLKTLKDFKKCIVPYRTYIIILYVVYCCSVIYEYKLQLVAKAK